MPKKKRQAVLLIVLIVSENINFKYGVKTNIQKIKPSFNHSSEKTKDFWRKAEDEVSKPMARKLHKLVDFKGWQLLSLVGVVGTCSNLLVLHFFYSEPNMATSVNAMIFMETIYRVGYTLTIQWRTFNIVHEHTLLSHWFTREKVSKFMLKLILSY